MKPITSIRSILNWRNASRDCFGQHTLATILSMSGSGPKPGACSILSGGIQYFVLNRLSHPGDLPSWARAVSGNRGFYDAQQPVTFYLPDALLKGGAS